MKKILISIDEFCIHHKLEFSFIQNLREFGLLETVSVKQVEYIPENQIEKLERILRLHDDLNINIEGIDTIDNLLSRINELRNQVTTLKNRLRLYEDID